MKRTSCVAEAALPRRRRVVTRLRDVEFPGLAMRARAACKSGKFQRPESTHTARSGPLTLPSRLATSRAPSALTLAEEPRSHDLSMACAGLTLQRTTRLSRRTSTITPSPPSLRFTVEVRPRKPGVPSPVVYWCMRSWQRVRMKPPSTAPDRHIGSRRRHSRPHDLELERDRTGKSVQSGNSDAFVIFIRYNHLTASTRRLAGSTILCSSSSSVS